MSDLLYVKVNKLLVEIFNDILYIEQHSLRQGKLSDLSVTEIHTIEAIGVDRNRSMSEVASALNITVGTLTTAINRLISKGYVERKRIEEDRRVVKIDLTKKGQFAYRLHERFHHEMIKNMMSDFSEAEDHAMIQALEKLSAFFKDKEGILRNSKKE
jgi:DNA-binding MarR family transcriptional regulator